MKRLFPILMLTLAGLALTACAGSTPPLKLELARPDSALTAPCAAPVTLPDRAMVQAEVEKNWRKDRTSLQSCSWKQGSLVKFYSDRDKALKKK